VPLVTVAFVFEDEDQTPPATEGIKLDVFPTQTASFPVISIVEGFDISTHKLKSKVFEYGL
jgi:hypothetical protein